MLSLSGGDRAAGDDALRGIVFSSTTALTSECDVSRFGGRFSSFGAGRNEEDEEEESEGRR
jgi:hypothetical protein